MEISQIQKKLERSFVISLLLTVGYISAMKAISGQFHGQVAKLCKEIKELNGSKGE